MPEDLREPLEKRSVSLTPTQWAWLDRLAMRNQTRSQSAELRRLIERERMQVEQVAAA